MMKKVKFSVPEKYQGRDAKLANALSAMILLEEMRGDEGGRAASLVGNSWRLAEGSEFFLTVDGNTGFLSFPERDQSIAEEMVRYLQVRCHCAYLDFEVLAA